jgi:quercetin dioxygenase-like cupin family protein
MYVKDYRDVPSEPGGADGLTIRWVINASQGATTFAMRVLELEPGKVSPLHQHDNEHEAFVLEGQGEVESGNSSKTINEGSVVFIPGRETHQFRNTGKNTLRFIDVVTFPIIMPK